MSRPALVLQELEIRRFKGVRRREDEIRLGPEDLCDAVNLVYGPNASGKTTTALAIQAALWPAREPAVSNDLSARYRVNGQSWDVKLVAGQAGYTCNGRTDNRPDLPPDDRGDRYRLALHELLAAEDRELAALIQNEINGGYDLGAAAETLGFNARIPKASIGESRAFRESECRLREVSNSQEALAAEERRMLQLRRELDEAEQAGLLAPVLDGLVRLRRQQQVRDEARARMTTFDPRSERLQGNELEVLAELVKDRESLVEERIVVRASRERVRKDIAQTGLDDSCGLDSQRLSSLRSLQQDMSRSEQEIAVLEREVAAADSEQQSARSDMGENVSDEQLQALGTVQLERLIDFARDAETFGAREQACKKLLDWLEDFKAPDERSTEAMLRGMDMLTDWLSRSSDPRPMARIAGVTGAVSLCALAALSVYMGNAMHPAWYGLSLLPLLVLALSAGPGGRTDRGACSHIETEYERLGLPPPGHWDRQAVHITLETLNHELAALRFNARGSEFRRGVVIDEKNIEAEGRELARRREEVAGRLGLSPDTHEVRLCLVVENLMRWQKARATHASRRAALLAAHDRHQERLGRFNDLIAPLDIDGVADSHASDGLVESLSERYGRLREARIELAAVERRLSELDEAADAALGRLLRFLTGAGIDGGEFDQAALSAARQQLHGMLERLDDWRLAGDALRDAEREVDRLAAEVRSREGFEPRLENFTDEEIHDRLAQARQLSAGVEDLRHRITELLTLVKETRRRHDLESALADRDRAAGKLCAVRGATLAAVAGDLLSDYVSGRSQTSASAVLTRARTLFADITRHSFELAIDGQRSTFHALTNSGERLDLEQLSSGTRVQLLFAVRLAFVEVQEGAGPRLPLILDEVLGNSDDDRAHAIIDAVLAIAATGRQVFYFTAQYDEIGKWRALMKDRPEIPSKLVCLPSVGAAPSQLAVERPEPVPVPKPGDMSYEEYGRLLGVPDFDPACEGVGDLHLWHVLDACEPLHSLLEKGYRTWGQLEGLVRTHGADRLTRFGLRDAGAGFERARTVAALHSEAGRLWRIGRGRPLDAEALARSGAVSEKYIESVTTLVRGGNHDASEMLAAMRNRQVRGFQSRKIDELEAFLAREGYLAARPPLSREQVRMDLDAFAIDAVTRDVIPYAAVCNVLAKLRFPEPFPRQLPFPDA